MPAIWLSRRFCSGDGRQHLVLAALHARLQPGPLLEVLDVPVLDADVAAVGVLQARPDLAQRRLSAGHQHAGVEPAVHVLLAQAEVRGLEAGGGDVSRARERVERRRHVAVQAVALDQLVDAGLQVVLLGAAGARRGRRRLALVLALEVAEDGQPVGVDGVRVPLVCLVEGLEEREVVPAERGLDIHGRAAVYSFARV
jgi:hypothetical protein